MEYYLGLSLLSIMEHDCVTKRHALLSAEARRIVSLLEGRPITEDDIARESTGRPFLPGGGTDFNISHSGAFTAVSLARGKNLRTGCDVEFVRPRTGAGKIAEEFFTAPERDYIESGGSFDLTRFYRIWTLKECFLKLRGLSVFDMIRAPSFISGDGSFTFDPVGVSPVSFNLYEFTDGGDQHYILATAIAGTEEQPEIRWFSQDFPDCKSMAKINAAPSPADTVRPKI